MPYYEKTSAKLFYLAKEMPIKASKELASRMDVSGFGDFSMMYSRYLENPETKDPLILSIIPGYTNPECVREFNEMYAEKFEKINELCKRNGVKPLFPEPKNIKECELIRRDLVKERTEDELNAFFGVSSFREYKPKFYSEDM